MSKQLLTKDDYSKHKSWKDIFSDGEVDINKIQLRPSWKKVIKPLFEDKRTQTKINDKLTEELKLNKQIYPHPESLFRAFNTTKYKNIKVVILGQDPYFDFELCESIKVPQAMGLSFSVPKGINIPSSLSNIYKNLKINGHIEKMPVHGNLESWANQGCLLLNTSLTVLHGSNNKNCHQGSWNWFTNGVIQHISDNCDNVVFVLWGSNALEKMQLIDLDKHEVIVSSHPSGLSCHKPMKQYPAFNDVDQFGDINKKLKEWGKTIIDWNV
jgi:uracil-DNA glycosylase